MLVYRGDHFAPLSVTGLLHKVKVSNVRPVPARLRGTIIGKGVPGLIWSEDFVMRDATGILFLDYRQPLRIWEWLFGLFRAGDFTGKTIEVVGWFRRAPVPYLELKSITVDGVTRNSYCAPRYDMSLPAWASYLESVWSSPGSSRAEDREEFCNPGHVIRSEADCAADRAPRLQGEG